MLLPVMIHSNWYKIAVWKRIVLTVCLTVVGTTGTYIMFFAENGWIGGTSFFGAVFFVPLPFIGIAKLLKISVGDSLDLCAPAECMMLAIMKVQCLLSGCCGGRILFENAEGVAVRFPSQLAEMINAIILLILLMIMAYKGRNRGELYPWYVLLYGISRFILNFFREGFVTTSMLIPFGTIWSVVAMILGTVWLVVLRKNQRKKQHSTREKRLFHRVPCCF
jgi:phosphatidylglycerol:prolipoprotein diacylglycerol transferase